MNANICSGVWVVRGVIEGYFQLPLDIGSKINGMQYDQLKETHEI